MERFEELLFTEFSPYGHLSPVALSLLSDHYKLLLKWNRVLNLTRLTDLLEVVRFHYCESLFLGTVVPPGALKIADVGSGAGFPGIPLAAFRPEVSVTLIESDQRKAVFLRESSRGFGNIVVLPLRAEEVEEHYDWVVSRAVLRDEVLSLRLATNLALLNTERQPFGGFWRSIKLPWGKDRVVSVREGGLEQESGVS